MIRSERTAAKAKLPGLASSRANIPGLQGLSNTRASTAATSSMSCLPSGLILKPGPAPLPLPGVPLEP